MVVGAFASWLILRPVQPAGQPLDGSVRSIPGGLVGRTDDAWKETGEGAQGAQARNDSPSSVGTSITDAIASTQDSHPVETIGSERIAGIISDSTLDFAGTAERQVGLLSELAEQEQEEAGHHIANLTENEALARIAPLNVGKRLPRPALDVIYPDLLNRPHEIVMPILAAIADATQHPKREEVIGTLEFLYGSPGDGQTWSGWVAKKLARPPMETGAF